VRVDELAGRDVLTLDVVLQLLRLDAPLTAATDLDGRELGASHERVDLRDGGVEHLGNVREGEETGPGHGSHSATAERGVVASAHPSLWMMG